MRKFLFAILAIALFVSCKKQMPENKYPEETSFNKEERVNSPVNIEQSRRACPLSTIKICTQNWMVRNLDVTTYRNGDPIQQVTDPGAWSTLTTGAWCYYQNNSANGPVYGKLYNWYAVNDPRGLAPKGFHIPTDEEWNTILNCLGGYELAGGAMKQASITNWATPNTGATNSSGFTALPGGARDESGLFANNGFEGIWWSATENNSVSALHRNLVHFAGSLGRGYADKGIGASVRCVRN